MSTTDGTEVQSGPNSAQQRHRTSDQNRPEKPPRKGGRHRAPGRQRFTPPSPTDLLKIAYWFDRGAEEFGKHEASIRAWFHTHVEAAWQIVDALVRQMS
ncbi:hypothetical protein [Actinoplanes sp. URMC 104]|uniref:hypothetical protein n=1 Tax=Actinoplanes sp. URMC 104 TaxID=3423409 RepID=UPI003F1AD1D8